MKIDQIKQMMKVLLDDMNRVISILEKTDNPEARAQLSEYYNILSARWDDLYKLSWN